MKKKGFTLVELIAVVAILSIILVMFVPSLLNSINNNKNEALNKIYDLIETGARNYVMDYNINTPTRIELEDLCNTTYIECPIINPVTEEELGGYIFVNDDYHYSKVNETFITVDLNGGESAQTFNSSYEPGNVIELIEPTKVNNVFKGWKVVKGNSGIRDNKLIVGTTETILWAEWGIKELINLTVDLDGGSINENPSGDYELGTIITLDSPTKENYRFTGWEVVEGNSILSGSTLTIGINSTKIKALWELNTYTITLNANGGYYLLNEFATSGEYEYNVSQTGEYNLEVWGAQGGNANAVLGGYGGYSTGKIYLEKGEILYVNVGGQGEDGQNTTAEYTTAGGYNGGGTGYVGTSKYYVAGGGGATHIATRSGLLSELEDYKDDILIVAGGGGGVAYNSDTAKTFTIGHGGGYIGLTSSGTTAGGVTANASGGTQEGPGSSGDAMGTFGQGASIKTASRAGGGGGYYGGNTSAYSAGGGSGYIGNALLTNKVMYCYNCDTSDEGSTKTISTTNVSLTATKNYTKKGDGAVKISKETNVIDVVYGSVYEKLPTPSRKGYKFAGFTTNSSGDNDGYEWENWSGEWTYTNGQNGISNNELNLYAIWEINTYTITYSLGGGTAGSSAPTEGTYGSTVTISNPTRTGYEFTGWTVSGEGATLSGTKLTIGTGNITLTAKWKSLYTYLFNYGTTYTWNNTAMNPGSDCESSNRNTLSVKTNSDGSLKLTQSKDYSGGAYTVKVDLTNYSSVVLEGTIPSGSHWGIWSAIPKQDSCDDWIGEDRVKSKTSAGTIDVSSLKGSYYIGIYVYKKQDTVSATLKTLKLVK